MIKYDLACEAGHGFEVWFRDMAACDAQLARKDVTCPVCGSSDVAKAIMAPSVARRDRGDRAERTDVVAAAKRLELLRALRRQVEENCTYVGERFPEEARRIHYGETERQDIWGEATRAEAEALAEEGIQVFALPDTPRQDS